MKIDFDEFVFFSKETNRPLKMFLRLFFAKVSKNISCDFFR